MLLMTRSMPRSMAALSHNVPARTGDYCLLLLTVETTGGQSSFQSCRAILLAIDESDSID